MTFAIKALLLAVYLGIMFALNYYLLQIDLFTFLGIAISIYLFWTIVAHIFTKIRNKKKKVQGEPNSFIFPDKMAKSMKEVDMAIQYEASLLSMSFLLIGMIAFSIYMIFFTDFGWTFKGFYIFNSACGFVLMYFYLVTNYQQYIAYMQAKNIMNDYAAPTNDLKGGIN